MKLIYEAFDGTQFLKEADCLAYEKQRFDFFNSIKVELRDENGYCISIEDCIKRNCFSCVYTMCFSCKHDKQKFLKVLEEYDEYDTLFLPKSWDNNCLQYIYDCDCNGWVDAQNYFLTNN